MTLAALPHCPACSTAHSTAPPQPAALNPTFLTSPRTQGNYSDLLVSLSQIYSKLRGDSSGEKNEDAAQVGRGRG